MGGVAVRARMNMIRKALRTGKRGAGSVDEGRWRTPRAGVMLLDLAAEGAEQGLLFAQTLGDMERSNRLMDCLDKINWAQGRGAVHYAGEGLGERWRMRQKLKSAASTTGWAELPGVR